jgi:hypothetical protein
MSGTVSGKVLPNGLFLPDFVPDVWSGQPPRKWKKIFLIAVRTTKLYSYFLPRDLRNTRRFLDNSYAFTNNWRTADILVADHQRDLDIFLKKVGRMIHGHIPILLHTHEPVRSLSSHNTMRVNNRQAYVMNCSTGDVWVENTQYFPIDEQARIREHRMVAPPAQSLVQPQALNRTIAMIASYAKPNNVYEGVCGLS